MHYHFNIFDDIFDVIQTYRAIVLITFFYSFVKNVLMKNSIVRHAPVAARSFSMSRRCQAYRVFTVSELCIPHDRSFCRAFDTHLVPVASALQCDGAECPRTLFLHVSFSTNFFHANLLSERLHQFFDSLLNKVS